jgi:hypothetical protein
MMEEKVIDGEIDDMVHLLYVSLSNLDSYFLVNVFSDSHRNNDEPWNCYR